MSDRAMASSRLLWGTLAAVLLGGTGVWLAEGAIAPQVARAYRARLNAGVEYRDGESFESLLRRAEALGRSTVQQAFDEDALVTSASVMVLGQNGGVVAPLLSVEVERNEWSRLPDASQWATYYASARDFLGIPATLPQEPVAENEGEPELGTGDVQVTLRWSTTDDLDLWVTGPDGQRIFFGNPRGPSGAQLDVDSNAGCTSPTRTPVENVFWPEGNAPSGQYTVQVDLFTRCGEGSEPVEFELTILTLGETRTETGTVSDSNPRVSFDFTVE